MSAATPSTTSADSEAQTIALAKSIAASLLPQQSQTPITTPTNSAVTTSTSASYPPFSVAKYESLLTTHTIGRPLHYAPTVTSTMDLCKDALFGQSASRPKSGALWLADEQTKGRGRVEGRSWASPKNENLYFTLLMQLNDLPWDVQRKELTKLNQVVCLSVAKSIEQMISTATGLPVKSLPVALQPRVKWPNDVWVNGLKCSGMLIDSEIMGKEMSIVIGVGINVHGDMHHNADPTVAASATSIQQTLVDWFQTASPETIPTTITSSALVAGVSREVVLTHFLQTFESLVACTPEEILREYQRYDLLLGQSIIVMPKKREDVTSYYNAKALSYTPDGHLLIERESGQKEELVAEEVTIRPKK